MHISVRGIIGIAESHGDLRAAISGTSVQIGTFHNVKANGILRQLRPLIPETGRFRKALDRVFLFQFFTPALGLPHDLLSFLSAQIIRYDLSGF